MIPSPQQTMHKHFHWHCHVHFGIAIAKVAGVQLSVERKACLFALIHGASFLKTMWEGDKVCPM